MKKVISTPQAPAAIGPYSQAIKAGNFIFVSGQLPIDPATGSFAGNDIVSQTAQSLKNGKSILEAAGYALNDVVKTTVFLADMKEFGEMNQVYQSFFPSECPARSAVEVAELPKAARVEIEMIAYQAE